MSFTRNIPRLEKKTIPYCTAGIANYVTMTVSTASHTSFLIAANRAFKQTLQKYLNSKGCVGRASEKRSYTQYSIKFFDKLQKKDVPPQQIFKRKSKVRAVNVYYGAHTRIEEGSWNLFIRNILESPIGDTVEVILATQCVAASKPDGRPSQTCISLAFFDISENISVLPLNIPLEDSVTVSEGYRSRPERVTGSKKTCFYNTAKDRPVGVITLPTVLSQHWGTISGKECLAFIHLKDSITSDHVLPGLKRFLPKSQIIGAGGALSCHIWALKDNEAFTDVKKIEQRPKIKLCSKKSKEIFDFKKQQHKSHEKAAMTGILMVPNTECINFHDFFHQSSAKKTTKIPNITSGMHVVGEPLTVTSVQSRIITSLNNNHPLNILISITSEHHAVGQTLVIGRYSQNQRDIDTHSEEYTTFSLGQDPAPSAFSHEHTGSTLECEVYPIMTHVTKSGDLECMHPIEVGDKIVVLRVDSETERIRFRKKFPLGMFSLSNSSTHVSNTKTPENGQQRLRANSESFVQNQSRCEKSYPSAILGFTCDSFMSRDYSCWNLWHQLGINSHGGYFRFQIYNGREYHCSTSWCELLEK